MCRLNVPSGSKNRVKELQVTHRLPPPPAVVQLLSRAQAERGIEDGVVHGVSHNAVGLWVETLETQQSNGSRVRRGCRGKNWADGSYCGQSV